MTLEKAIEKLTLHFKGHTVKRDPDFFNACYLGIEAMKLIKSSREWNPTIPYKLLPGETKE